MIYTKKDSESLVSVITPSYNSSPFIKETIESVQAQSYSNWEMIIVDDKSKDDSVHIIKQYIEKDTRIKLITLTQNAGAARARNIALKEAQGDYIAFLDADDLWKPLKIEKQLQFLKDNKVPFSLPILHERNMIILPECDGAAEQI